LPRLAAHLNAAGLSHAEVSLSLDGSGHHGTQPHAGTQQEPQPHPSGERTTFAAGADDDRAEPSESGRNGGSNRLDRMA
jgi:hypothetical protein